MSANTNPTGKAAFEITKGTRHVLALSEADVERHLDPHELIDALEEGFRGLESGDVQCPPRTMLSVPGKGFSLAMPAWRPGMQLAVKVVNVFDGNLSVDLPSHLAWITLFDPANGLTTCVMDGTFVTAMRTAAAAALSARMLSRHDSRVATIIGAGVQGREHLRQLPLVRNVDRIYICSVKSEDAGKLAERSPIAQATTDVEAAVHASDIVCLATSSATPVIEAAWIKPGTHVSSVGYCPPGGELRLGSREPIACSSRRSMRFSPRPWVAASWQDSTPRLGPAWGRLRSGAGRDVSATARSRSTKAWVWPWRTWWRPISRYERARRDGGGGTMVW